MIPTPEQTAQARRVVTDPATILRVSPAITRSAWWMLKAAQGFPITARAADRLAKPICADRPAIHPRNDVLAEMATARGENPVIATTRAALPATRAAVSRLIAARSAPTGGDAA